MTFRFFLHEASITKKKITEVGVRSFAVFFFQLQFRVFSPSFLLIHTLIASIYLLTSMSSCKIQSVGVNTNAVTHKIQDLERQRFLIRS